MPPSIRTALGQGFTDGRLDVLVCLKEHEEAESFVRYFHGLGVGATVLPDAAQLSMIVGLIRPGLAIMDSIDDMRRLRKQPGYQDLPVIVIGGSTDMEVLRAYKSGADFVLFRPIDFLNPMGFGR